MRYLLDVNVLVAWGWADHVDHTQTAGWIAEMKKKRGTSLLTTPISELGFVRVSVHRTAGRLPPKRASEILDGMLRTLGSRHMLLPDDLPSTRPLPDWCRGARQTTDAHLLTLAENHRATLATLDCSIPGAFLVQ